MNMAMEELSDRIRDRLPAMLLTEKKMFGGRCFMLSGNMLVCPLRDGNLMVRVGKDFYDEALTLPGATAMDMGPKTMVGFIAVSGDMLEDDDILDDWIARARAFVDTLPPK